MRLIQALLVVLVLSACGMVVHKSVQVFMAPVPERSEPVEVDVEEVADPPAPSAAPREPRPEAQAAIVGETAAAPADTSASISAKNAEAIRLLEAGDIEGAIALFEECRAAAPDEEVFARNLAEALARHAARLYEEASAESIEAALANLGRAVELDPEREELARLYGRWKRSAEAEKEFASYGSELFELVYDGVRKDLSFGIPALLEKLEKVYHEFGDLFGFFPVESGRPQIRVIFYDRKEFDNVTGLGHWAGGVFDGSVRVPVEDLGREGRRIEVVLRHELLHAFVQEAGGRSVPGWLNEGLAQYVESPTGGQRATDVHIARSKLQDRELFPIERLQGSLATWEDPREIRIAYAQSLALVAYIAGQYGESIIFEMISKCSDGKTPAETFRARIGIDLSLVIEDLERELEQG